MTSMPVFGFDEELALAGESLTFLLGSCRVRVIWAEVDVGSKRKV